MRNNIVWDDDTSNQSQNNIAWDDESQPSSMLQNIGGFALGALPLPATTPGETLKAALLSGPGISPLIKNFIPQNILNQKMPESSTQMIGQQLGLPNAPGVNLSEKLGTIASGAYGLGKLAFAAPGIYRALTAAPLMSSMSVKNMPFLLDFMSSLPENATSQDMANAAVNGGFKNIMDKIENHAKTAYAPSTLHIFDPNGKVDLTGFTVNPTPSDHDLLQYMTNPSMRSTKFLNSPGTRELLTAMWNRDNPGNILSDEDISNINPTVRNAVSNFMQTQNPTDLMNLKRMAGSNLAKLNPRIAQNGAAISAYKNLDSITGQIMENHLNQIDPTGNALIGLKQGNNIRSTMYHPVMNGSTLERMSTLNPASATTEFPKGQPYYFNGASPDAVNTAVLNAQQKQARALGPDHPITELNNMIQQKQALEQNMKSPGFISRNLPSLMTGNIKGVLANELMRKFFKP